MNFLEKKVHELHKYSPDSTAPEDLDLFWKKTLDAAAQKPLNDRKEQWESYSPFMEVNKVVYEGFDQTPLHGWYLLPKFALAAAGENGLPCVVCFHGYSGSKGNPEDYSNWLMMGYAVFAVDVRGQNGETGNLLPQQFGMTKGWITQGLLDPEQSYYQAFAVDGVKAIEWAALQPEVDPNRIVIAGGSQGGGLALLAGALSDKPWKIIADIPSMCHLDYGIFNSTGSLTEAAAFVSRNPDKLDQVLHTMSYFDMLNLHDRIQAPILMSVSLKDTVCMPETIFAVYNRLTGPKEIHVYPFLGHAVGPDGFRNRIKFLNKSFS
jgi:cephalosporin-C deacetylase